MPIAAPTWPQATTVDEIRRNLAAVRERIARACALAGRDPASVRLLPVSKTVDEARLRLAWDAGCHELGENKVQEAQRKAAAMAMNESNEATYQFIARPVTPGTSTGPAYSDFATDFTGKSRGLDVYLTGDFEALSLQQRVLLGANYST